MQIARYSSFASYTTFGHASYFTAGKRTYTCDNVYHYRISGFVWHAGGGIEILTSLSNTPETSIATSLVYGLEDAHLIQIASYRVRTLGGACDRMIYLIPMLLGS